MIGAGAAGLAAVKTLAESGREVDCFEATDRVGGHWNTDYDALHLITSRDVTGFEGFPMPADYPLFPSRDQVLAYLNAYADHFALRRHIRFGTGVDSVVPVADDGLGRIGRLGRHDHRRPGAALRRRVRGQRAPARPAHPRRSRHLHRQADPLRLVRQHLRHRRRPRPGHRVRQLRLRHRGRRRAEPAHDRDLCSARALLPTQDVLRRPARGAGVPARSSPSRSRTCSPG